MPCVDPERFAVKRLARRGPVEEAGSLAGLEEREVHVRWDDLFADLAGQLDEAAAAEQRLEVADRTRREVAVLRLVDRLRVLPGERVRLQVLGAGTVEGTLCEVGPDWVLVDEAYGRQALVPLAVVLATSGARRHSSTPGREGHVRARLTLGYALRGVARDRSAVSVLLVDGTSRAGTLDRVGSDFVELAEHAPGEPRRWSAVDDVVLIPHAAIAVVRSS